LAPVRLKSGKVVEAWATPADVDVSGFRSNTFELEYPKGSGVTGIFPEVDRIDWFDLASAQRKINVGQVGLLLELKSLLS
jgi:predicted NUDIX family NTP pyrophosphohydrolase